MTKRCLNPELLFKSVDHGFSQAVLATGTMVFVSGQVAWNVERQIVGRTLVEQTRQSLRNLEVALDAAGGSMNDVASVRIYIVEAERANLHQISEALREAFPSDPPASTWIGVSFLANQDFLVEIEATALIASTRYTSST